MHVKPTLKLPSCNSSSVLDQYCLVDTFKCSRAYPQKQAATSHDTHVPASLWGLMIWMISRNFRPKMHNLSIEVGTELKRTVPIMADGAPLYNLGEPRFIFKPLQKDADRKSVV